MGFQRDRDEMQQPEADQVGGPAAESAIGRRKQLYFSEQSKYVEQYYYYKTELAILAQDCNS